MTPTATGSPTRAASPSGDGGGPARVRRPRWGRIVALATAAVVVAVAAWFALSLFQPFAGDGGDRVGVVVPRGSSLEQIADLLEERGVISDSGFFQLRARLAGRSDELKPGRYTLRRDMSFTAALDELERRTSHTYGVLTNRLSAGCGRTYVGNRTPSSCGEARIKSPHNTRLLTWVLRDAEALAIRSIRNLDPK